MQTPLPPQAGNFMAQSVKEPKPLPPIPSLPTGIIDSHAHVVKEFFTDNREEIIADARAHGLKQLINPGVTVAGIGELLELAEKYPFIWTAVGQHPHDAKDFNEAACSKLKAALSHPKVVAVGECGLDYFYNNSSREEQLKTFQQQIELALEFDKPIIIHCRDAWQDAFALLKSAGQGKLKGVFHCFTGGPEHLEAIAELDFYISFSGILTYNKAKSIQEAAPLAPANRILVETDCPFLAPQKVRGQTNKPAYVWFTAEKLAQLRGITLEEAATLTMANTRELFRLPESDS